jgi:hypothetical protein
MSIHELVLAFSGIDAPTHFQDTRRSRLRLQEHVEPIGGLGNAHRAGPLSEPSWPSSRGATFRFGILDPDPLQNVEKQVLENIGTFAPKSVVPFGDIDVFFLSDSGIRSLRARDSSNQAGMSDVGTPIDEYLLDYLSTLTEERRRSARSAASSPSAGATSLRSAPALRLLLLRQLAHVGMVDLRAACGSRDLAGDGRSRVGAHGRHASIARRR